VGAVGEKFERGGRSLDALQGGARHHPGRQVLKHLEADALGHVIERLLHQRRIVRRRHQRRREYAGRSIDTNRFDAARRDEAQRVGEPQLVEKITGGAIGPRLAEKAAGIARRVDLRVVELPTDDADERAERRRHRQELDLASGFLGVVVERRLHAVDVEIAEADLVVVILDRAGPVADHVDGRVLRPKLALAGVLHLFQGNAGVGLRAGQGGNIIERAEAGDRGAHIAAVEQVGAADRLSLGVERGVRLLAVERRRRIGGKKIGIARDEIIVALAAVDVGVEGEVARARVDQRAALGAPVDRGGGAEDLRLPAARRRQEGNAVVGRLHDAADRLRAVAQRVRAAKDLHLLNRQRIERYPMVLAQIGNVQGADAVLLHAHAEIVEAA
jgi:hypothetical protein